MKIDFKYLRKKDKLFNEFFREFVGYIKLLRNNYGAFNKLFLEQANFLASKKQELEDFSGDFWQKFQDDNKELEIPYLFKEFVNRNIVELKTTYSQAENNLRQENNGFKQRLMNSLVSIKKLAKPFKYSSPINHIWGNNDEHRDNTIKKFLPIDAIHSLFMLTPVYYANESLENQLILQEQIPHQLEVKKYTLMMAYVNAKYKLGYTKEEVEGRGVFLKFLSENPRGKGNPALPSWGYLFHNASNHSMGCVVLFRSLCCDTHKKPRNEEAKNIIKAYERRMTEAYIFHDGGEEYFREALVAGEMAKIEDKELVKKIYNTRDKFEDFSYKKFTIQKVVNYCKKYFYFNDDFANNLSVDMSKATYLNPFEHKLLEVLEKLHTSSDLIRMRNKGAIDSPTEMLLKFTYVAKHLYGLDLKVEMEELNKMGYEEYSKKIAEFLSKATPNFEKSLVGQIEKSLEGKSELEKQVLRERYLHDAKKAHEEFCHYAKKVAGKFDFDKISKKNIEKFLQNCESVMKNKGRG